MFGLNPVTLYLIVGLVFTNLMTLTAWRFAAKDAEAQSKAREVCEVRFAGFRSQVEALGKEQERKVERRRSRSRGRGYEWEL